MKQLLMICFCLFSLSSQGQNDFNGQKAAQELKRLINEYRAEQQLSLFETSDILDAVAFEQAEYILDQGRLSHEQDNEKKKTLLDRIRYFEGGYAQAGENLMSLQLGTKLPMKVGGEKQEVLTEEATAQASIAEWLDEEESRLNLMDGEFEHFGTAVVSLDGKVILVLVTASLPYKNPGLKKLPFDYHGIEPYKKEACDKFLDKHGTLPQLFSDALEVKDNEVYFSFHSLHLFKHIFENGGDGIAIDLVARDQFACGGSNRLFPGEINRGLLLKPSKKAKLYNANEKMEENKVWVSIAELPDFYKSEDYELNAIIIKDGVACETVPYNRIKTLNLKEIENRYLLAGDTLKVGYSWEDSLSFEIPLNSETEKEQALDQMKQKLTDLNFLAEEIYIKRFVPPSDTKVSEADSSSELNKMLSAFSDSTHRLEVEVEQDWQSYQEFQDNSFYQIETKGMKKPEVERYLAKTQETDSELKEFLKGLNRYQIRLKGKAVAKKSASPKSLLESCESLLNRMKIKEAATIQKFLIQQYGNEAEVMNGLPKLDPSQRQKTLPLINNQIVLNSQSGKDYFEGNPIHKAFLELHLVDQSNAVVSFNYHLATLRYWAKRADKMKKPEDWLDKFEKLRGNSQVPDEQYARAILNYYLLAANFHYDAGEFGERKGDFDDLMDWQSKANLEPNEQLELAQYLCHQDQFPRAIKVLNPTVKKPQVDEDLLFYYLQIYPYDTEEFKRKHYVSLMEKAQKLYPEHFCQFFSKAEQGIQALVYQEIKSIYCSQCQ
ncbi:MAG: CAP domain-containing protein [Vicingaceae bacterium]